MTIIPFQDAVDKIQKELNISYTTQTMMNDLIREAHNVCSGQDTTTLMENHKNSLLKNLRENSRNLSEEENEKLKKDICENFNKLSLRYYACPVRLSIRYKGFVWVEEKNYKGGYCLKWDNPLFIRTQDILKFVGGEDIAVSLSFFTNRDDKQSYVTLKDHLSLSDIGLTLDHDGNHDECARQKIISEKVAALQQEVKFSKDDLIFDEYSFNVIRKNLLSQHQSESPVSDKHTAQNDITDSPGKVDALNDVNNQSSKKGAAQNSDHSAIVGGGKLRVPQRISRHVAEKNVVSNRVWKTWLKYMLTMAVFYAETDRKKFFQSKSIPKGLIFNYAQLETDAREMAVKLWGDDANETRPGHNFSDTDIQIFLDEALNIHPAKIQAAGKNVIEPRVRRTCLRYMLIMTVLVANTQRKKFFHSKLNPKGLIFNYAQLEEFAKSTAETLWGGDANKTSSTYGLTDANISKIISEVLEDYPINIEQLLRQ